MPIILHNKVITIEEIKALIASNTVTTIEEIKALIASNTDGTPDILPGNTDPIPANTPAIPISNVVSDTVNTEIINTTTIDTSSDTMTIIKSEPDSPLVVVNENSMYLDEIINPEEKI